MKAHRAKPFAGSLALLRRARSEARAHAEQLEKLKLAFGRPVPLLPGFPYSVDRYVAVAQPANAITAMSAMATRTASRRT